MKIITFYISILLFFIAVILSSSTVMSAENINKKEININLINITEEDYINYYQPFFFSESFNVSRHYTYGNEIFKPATNTFNFFSDKKNINEKSYSLLSANAVDAQGSPFLIEWTISDGFSEDFRKKEALNFTSGLFLKSQKEDIKSIVSEEFQSSFNITNLTPVYPDEEVISSINGYEFDYRIKRTPTYYAVRTSSEILLSCGMGVINYYMNKYENKVDWQYQYSWEDAEKKVKDGWYWDPNNFNTNTIYHLYAGMAYQIARSNNYSMLESFAWSFGGSFMWEFFGEWREQVSLNDMIFTPMLGSITGEALIQTCDYIERNMKPGLLREFIQLAINPFGWINRMIDETNSGDIKVRLIFINPLQAAVQEKFEEELMQRN